MKMLVALDGSERSLPVLNAALRLAGENGKLLLFRAVGLPRHLPSAAFATSPNEVAALLEKEARDELLQLEARVPTALRAGVRVDVGPTWPSIERAAQEADVDLIVIGSHGYGGIDRFIGTTAAKVVNHADRSVLVVRDGGRLSA